MKYFMQAMAMLTDIVIIGAVAILLYIAPLNPIAWVMVLITFKTWQKQGEFIAWDKNNIKMFLKIFD